MTERDELRFCVFLCLVVAIALLAMALADPAPAQTVTTEKSLGDWLDDFYIQRQVAEQTRLLELQLYELTLQRQASEATPTDWRTRQAQMDLMRAIVRATPKELDEGSRYRYCLCQKYKLAECEKYLRGNDAPICKKDGAQ